MFITCTHDIIGTDRFEITGDKGKIVVDDSKKVTIKRLKQSKNEMNATMDWADAMKLFMGGGLVISMMKKYWNLKVYGENSIVVY